MKYFFSLCTLTAGLSLLLFFSSFDNSLPEGRRIAVKDFTFTGKPIIEMMTVLDGTYKMGSPEDEAGRNADEQQHNVTLKSFRISKYEITFEQYDAFCDATKRNKPDDNGWGRGKRPVVGVTWDDAKAFAKWMDCRLPTEAEWEYACRAGSTTAFSTGSCISRKQANFNGIEIYNNCAKGETSDMTKEAGSYASNKFMIYDMHGNVWEWCSDWYGPYEKFSQSDPKGPDFGEEKVYRGGSWSNVAVLCRSACRGHMSPKNSSNDVGFRIVTRKY